MRIRLEDWYGKLGFKIIIANKRKRKETHYCFRFLKLKDKYVMSDSEK